MGPFHRSEDQLIADFDDFETTILLTLVTDLTSLLESNNPANDDEVSLEQDPDDPFAFWARDLEVDPDQPEEPEDPALRRLFPTAYSHDAQAASDFRRFTQHGLYESKLTDLAVVRADLATIAGTEGTAVIADDHVDGWLKSLTSVRLVLGSRVGADDEDQDLSDLDPDDPRARLVDLFNWLGYVQESLVEAL